MLTDSNPDYVVKLSLDSWFVHSLNIEAVLDWVTGQLPNVKLRGQIVIVPTLVAYHR